MTWNYYNITKEEEIIDYLTDLIKEVDETSKLDKGSKNRIVALLERIIDEESNR